LCIFEKINDLNKKLPKVNSHTTCENPPNPVTLIKKLLFRRVSKTSTFFWNRERIAISEKNCFSIESLPRRWRFQTLFFPKDIFVWRQSKYLKRPKKLWKPLSFGAKIKLENWEKKPKKSLRKDSFTPGKFEPYFATMYQGCQMVCFQTKNPNLGKLWRALEWERLAYSMAIWYI
jgi:hypothetical protein